MKLRALLIYGPALLLAVATVRAGDAGAATASDFNVANASYESGHYDQAAADYRRMVETGRVSPALCFNFGNTCFKLGQVGKAIALYRQALDLAPRDPDVRANLKFVRNQVKFPHFPPPPRTLAWVSSLTLNEWSILYSVAASGWFVLLLLRTVRPPWRDGLRGYTGTLGTVALVLAGALGLSVQQHLLEKTCVVTATEAVIRRGPYPESQSYFTAPDGAEFRLVEERGDWIEVDDGDGRLGWLNRTATEILAGGV